METRILLSDQFSKRSAESFGRFLKLKFNDGWRCCSVGPKFEDFAEPGGGTGVNKEGALISPEVFPVSAAKSWKTVDWNESFITFPPENHSTYRDCKPYD